MSDAFGNHINAHVGGRKIDIFFHDALQNFFDNREDFEIAIIADGGLTIFFEVKIIDHVLVGNVSSGGFVGKIDGVFERKIPDGEGFKFGIAGFDAALMFVVELR